MLCSRSLKALPPEERPRERLARFGPDGLSTRELLAILLGSGTKGRSVLDLAGDLLSHFGSIQKLCEASLQELQEVKGIKMAKAVQLQAAFACVRRLHHVELTLLDTPLKVYTTIRSELEGKGVEKLLVLLRDAKGKLIHREILGIGILDEVLLHPREVYYAAIKHRAHSLIIAHNHPSGDPTPSPTDREMTTLLFQAGQVLGIPLADHLIIGGNGYVSFYEKKWLVRQGGY